MFIDILVTICADSLANPWLDFLPAAEARTLASKLNDDIQEVCASPKAQGRLFAFGALPTLDADGCVAEVRRLATLPHVRGVIMGTSGLGRGLDDERLTPLWAALEETGLVTFLHPHYGVGGEHFHGTGHALALALGFPFETSVAVSRLIVSGRLEQFPRLRMLLAHSGGTLPYLVGRLDSCVAHDLALAARLPHAPSHYLRRLYFDALSYHLPTLQALIQFAGADRVVFGTGTQLAGYTPSSCLCACNNLTSHLFKSSLIAFIAKQKKVASSLMRSFYHFL